LFQGAFEQIEYCCKLRKYDALSDFWLLFEDGCDSTDNSCEFGALVASKHDEEKNVGKKLYELGELKRFTCAPR
jgi:hypothetical protein